MKPSLLVPEIEADRAVVTLTLADQLCGLPVQAVRDVLGPQKLTRIPLSPPEVAGHLNLRGRIVTAIDLRAVLDLPPAPLDERMAIVTDVAGDLYAFLVDSVSDVASLSHAHFEANPSNLTPGWARVSAGVYRLQGRLLVLLDIARLLALRHVQV